MRACGECQHQNADDVRFCVSCGAACGPAAGPPDPFLGVTVNGKFKVEALIGQGGMGKVYRARHLTLDKPVVLKMLHRTYGEDPQIVQRFQREARAASRLNHANSIAVLDFGAAEDGTLFMAMEFLGGRDLAHVIAEDSPLPEGRIIRIGAQVLSALAEAHAQGIIHRDLKPENVMVEPRREEPDFVKVLDFGIAKITAAAEEPKLTAVGLVCGTPEYMSPEQARGADLDARSDLYSVGVILYQMATGDLPFHSDTPVGFLTKHLAEIPPPARQRRPDLSPALDALIRRTLEKDPARRPPDASAMREALLACATMTPAAPRPATPPPTLHLDITELPVEAPAPPTQAPPSRRRGPLLVGGLLLVAALVLAGLFLRQTPAPQAAGPATPETAVATAPVGPGPAPGTEPVVPPPAADPKATAPPAPTPVVATPAKQPVAAPPAPAPPPAAKPATPRRDRFQAHALVKQGDQLRAAGDVDGAIRAYLQADDLDATLPALQKKLAVCYQQQGDTARARERYQRYLATNPPDAAKVKLILESLQ